VALAERAALRGTGYIGKIFFANDPNSSERVFGSGGDEGGAVVFEAAGFFNEVIVGTGVGGDGAGVYVQDFGGEFSDEVHIVGNENECAFVTFEREGE
jgi:hypothetical protein